MKNLGELFNKYYSDKESSHGYSKYYEKHLPKTVDKFLELGCWKGGSIMAFMEYYDYEGEFHVINYIFGGEIISKEALNDLGVIPHEGRQEDIKFLKSIGEYFTVISDDCSHHSDAQIITFKQMFVNNLESGGLYVIEDVFGHLDGEDGAYWRRKVNSAEDTIMPLCRKMNFESQYFTKQESDLILSMINTIDIYDDKIIFITKK